jgi:hypothetical protein
MFFGGVLLPVYISVSNPAWQNPTGKERNAINPGIMSRDKEE